jgi:hypothetical protein
MRFSIASPSFPDQAAGKQAWERAMHTIANRLIVAMLVAFGGIVSAAQAWTVVASGVISEDLDHAIDDAGLFVAPGGSLSGLTYTETITTDPQQNGHPECVGDVSCLERDGGNYYGDHSGAAYTITTTVNGVSYTQTESSPYLNRSYLIDALSINDTTTTIQDVANQEIDSNGCSSVYAACTVSYILAYSLTTPFVPMLSFTQSITASTGLDPGSITYFAFRNSSGASTLFYGSISSLSINPPSPSQHQQLAELLGEVMDAGPGAGLANKLILALLYYAAKDVPATCTMLSAFVNEAQARAGKRIGHELDEKLIADAQAIETAIGCN